MSTDRLDKNHAYTVGIVPQFDARKVFEIWRPILNELQRLTGLEFTLRGSATIPSFEMESGSGDFDFVYMNPYQVLLAGKKQQGYIPLVRDTGKDLQGIVVVARTSSIHSVADLQQKVVAFPAPNALGATLLTQSELLDKYQVAVVPRYVKTHSSVYLNVALGQTVAGGGVQKTFAQQSPEVKNALRVLYRTQSVSTHPFTVHPRVSKQIRNKVQAAFLAMGNTDAGRKLLAQVPIKQIGSAAMSDYSAIKKMAFERFNQ